MSKGTITRDLVLIIVGVVGVLYQLFWVDPVNRGWMLFFIILIGVPSFFHNDNVKIASQTIARYLSELGEQNRREKLEKEKLELRRRLKRIEASLKSLDDGDE